MAVPIRASITFRTEVLFNDFAMLAGATKLQTWQAVRNCGRAIVKDVKRGPHAAPLNKKPPYTDNKGQKHPGALRRSYHAIEERGAVRTTVENDPDIADYAPWVELGATNGTPSQPHLIPAAKEAIDKMLKDMQDIPGAKIVSIPSENT